MTDLFDDLVESRLPWVSPAIRAWYDGSTLRHHLRSALSDEVDRFESPDFGAQFRDGVALEGAPQDPLAWANRRLELPGGGWAVTGIRFRGADARRPFVDVVATTEAPTPDGLAVVGEAVTAAYDAFTPVTMRADAPDADAMVEQVSHDPRFGPGCGVDMHVVAGLVEQLRQYPRAAAYPQVSLRAADPQPLAERVAAVYAELVASQPEVAMWARPEDLESLTECADEGLLFEVLVDGSPAGVVAAIRDDAHAMAGFSVQELCLDAAHRGRHVAAAAVQRLIDALPARPGDVLWGTIDPNNLPSLRNALSVGRVKVGGYTWITPSGFPGMPPTNRGQGPAR